MSRSPVDSFALGPGRGSNNAAQALTPTGVRVGGVGVQSPGLSALAPGVDTRGADRTIEVITKLAGAALAPQLKEAQDRQTIMGIQKAMTGQAITEIVAEEPWFLKIFGPSASVQGARAYTAQATVAQWAANVEQQMPELAKQSPEALREAALGAMEGLKTGDAQTDAVVTGEVMTQMAGLFKRHAKAHASYIQAESSSSQLRAWDNLGTLLQGRIAGRAKGEVNEAEAEAATSWLLTSLEAFPGQDPESYERNVVSFVGTQAAQGNFHVVNKLREAGILKGFTNPETRARLERELAASGRTALVKQAMPSLAPSLADVYLDRQQTAEEMIAKLEAINEQASALTGVPMDLATLVDRGTYDNMATSLLGAQENERRARLREAQDRRAAGGRGTAREQKAAEEAQLDAIALSILDNDRPGAVAQLGMARVNALLPVRDDNLDRAGRALWQAKASPEDRAKLLNRWAGNHKIKAADEWFATNLRDAPEINGNFTAAAQVAASLSPEGAGVYLPPDKLHRVLQFNRMVADNIDPAQAYQYTRTVLPVLKGRISSKELNEVQKTVRSMVDDEFEASFWEGKQTMPDGDQALVESLLLRHYETYRGVYGSTGDDAKAAIGKLKAAGEMSVLGNRLVLHADPDVTPLNKLGLGGTDGDWARAFKDELKAQAAGLDVDRAIIVRLPDRGDKQRVATFNISIPDPKHPHGEQLRVITSEQLFPRVQKAISGQTATRAPKGRPGTLNPASLTP